MLNFKVDGGNILLLVNSVCLVFSDSVLLKEGCCVLCIQMMGLLRINCGFFIVIVLYCNWLKLVERLVSVIVLLCYLFFFVIFQVVFIGVKFFFFQQCYCQWLVLGRKLFVSLFICSMKLFSLFLCVCKMVCKCLLILCWVIFIFVKGQWILLMFSELMIFFFECNNVSGLKVSVGLVRFLFSCVGKWVYKMRFVCFVLLVSCRGSWLLFMFNFSGLKFSIVLFLFVCFWVSIFSCLLIRVFLSFVCQLLILIFSWLFKGKFVYG